MLLTNNCTSTSILKIFKKIKKKTTDQLKNPTFKFQQASDL